SQRWAAQAAGPTAAPAASARPRARTPARIRIEAAIPVAPSDPADSVRISLAESNPFAPGGRTKKPSPGGPEEGCIGCAAGRGRRRALVPVVLGLERTVLLHADVGGLFGLQLGQLGAELVEVEHGHLLV